MTYDGQNPSNINLREFTERDRGLAYEAIRSAEVIGSVPYSTIEILDRKRLDPEFPSYQAGLLLGQIVSHSDLSLQLPKDRSGLAVGYDNAVGHLWKLQGEYQEGFSLV